MVFFPLVICPSDVDILDVEPFEPDTEAGSRHRELSGTA